LYKGNLYFVNGSLMQKCDDTKFNINTRIQQLQKEVYESRI